jgi:hypothetical protein
MVFPGPDSFSVIVFPVFRFVCDVVREPVTSVAIDPSEALRSLAYSLSTGKVTRTLNPQNVAGRVNGAAGRNVHL